MTDAFYFRSAKKSYGVIFTPKSKNFEPTPADVFELPELSIINPYSPFLSGEVGVTLYTPLPRDSAVNPTTYSSERPPLPPHEFDFAIVTSRLSLR